MNRQEVRVLIHKKVWIERTQNLVSLLRRLMKMSLLLKTHWQWLPTQWRIDLGQLSRQELSLEQVFWVKRSLETEAFCRRLCGFSSTLHSTFYEESQCRHQQTICGLDRSVAHSHSSALSSSSLLSTSGILKRVGNLLLDFGLEQAYLSLSAFSCTLLPTVIVLLDGVLCSRWLLSLWAFFGLDGFVTSWSTC